MVSAEGYLAWPLFSAVVFSLLLVLAADFVWRLVKWPTIQLVAAVLVVWASGVAAILLP